ncbi:uncharacterized protein DS421_15g498200 [Arachis hypogaea]|nr:uncharacterized protein DS421_15g498200 [Arachis hypogaea]
MLVYALHMPFERLNLLLFLSTLEITSFSHWYLDRKTLVQRQSFLLMRSDPAFIIKT